MNRSPLLIVRGARQLVTVRGAGGPRRGADMNDVGVVHFGVALMANGVILNIGTGHRIENLTQARRAQEIDASGCVVVPGFVDSSAHLPNLSAHLAQRLIAHGTTALRPQHPESRRSLRYLSDAGLDVANPVSPEDAPALAPSLPALAEEQLHWRQAIESGDPVALATGRTDSGAPAGSMTAAMALACIAYRLSPAEALCAATLNASHAIGFGETLGSLEIDKQADLVILDVPDYREIPYHLGVNLVRTVIKRGHVVYRRGEIRWPKL